MTYSQRIWYRRPPNAYLRAQWLGFPLTKLGISPRYVVTLEVPGRRSGIIRRTTLARVGYDGADYLMALAGESEWVRDVRAAGGRVVIGRTDRRAATPVEVPPQDRPAILRAYLQRSGRRPGSRAVTTRRAPTRCSASSRASGPARPSQRNRCKHHPGRRPSSFWTRAGTEVTIALGLSWGRWRWSECWPVLTQRDQTRLKAA